MTVTERKGRGREGARSRWREDLLGGSLSAQQMSATNSYHLGAWEKQGCLEAVLVPRRNPGLGIFYSPSWELSTGPHSQGCNWEVA